MARSEGMFRLEGCSYVAIDPTHVGDPPIEKHLAWLDLDQGYTPANSYQSAAAYRRAGHDQHADRVLVAKQRARRATLPRGRRIVDWLLDSTVAYGTRPWRAAVMLLFWIVTTSVIYTIIGGDAMTATSDNAPKLPTRAVRGRHHDSCPGLWTQSMVAPREHTNRNADCPFRSRWMATVHCHSHWANGISADETDGQPSPLRHPP